MTASRLNSIISNPELREKLAKRFWSKVDCRGPDECWPWTAKSIVSKHSPYGVLNLGRTKTSSSETTTSNRIAFALANNGIEDGVHVRHTCDNPRCCNPKHLLPGTNYDNVQDMISRGRHNTKQISETLKKIWRSGERQASDLTRETARGLMKKLWADPAHRLKMQELGRKNSAGKKQSPETIEKRRLSTLASKARKRKRDDN